MTERQDPPTPADPGPVHPEPAGEDGTARPREAARPREIGGPAGLEPTRYGDWERKGRCYDF